MEADRKNGKITDYNDPKTGKFVEGNPGRPKGSVGYGTMMNEAIKEYAKLNNIPESEIRKKLYMVGIAGALSKDYQFYKDFMDRTHGKPKQSIKFNGDVDVEVARKQAIPDNVRDAAWIALKSWGIIPEDEELPKIETENGKNIQQPKPEPECRSIAVIQQSAE